MNKIYLQPTMCEWSFDVATPLLANSFNNNQIEIDSSNMDEGDGSDAVKVYKPTVDWSEIDD